MTDNPFASDFTDDPGMYGEPSRTSVLAIFSLILSLACCIPGLGVLGAGLGIGAIIGISGSNGRVGGRGLAIAGIIIGLLVSLIWVGGVTVVSIVTDEILDTVSEKIEQLEDGRFDEFRSAAAPPASDANDEELAAFVADYQAKSGSFVSGPSGMAEYFSMLFDPAVAPRIQQVQGGQNLIPIVMTFDNGLTLVMLEFLPRTDKMSDMILVASDNTPIAISDYVGTSGPADPPADADDPADPADPAGGAPGDDGEPDEVEPDDEKP